MILEKRPSYSDSCQSCCVPKPTAGNKCKTLTIFSTPIRNTNLSAQQILTGAVLIATTGSLVKKEYSWKSKTTHLRTIILWFVWRTLQRKNSLDPQPEPQAGGGRDAQLALCGEAGGGDAGLLWRSNCLEKQQYYHESSPFNTKGKQKNTSW